MKNIGSKGVVFLLLSIIEVVLCVFLIMPQQVNLDFFDPDNSELLKTIRLNDKDLAKNSDGDVIVEYKKISNEQLDIQTYSGNISMRILNYGIPLYTLENQDITCYSKTNVTYPDNTYLKNLTIDEAIREYNKENYIFIVTINGDGGYKVGEDTINVMHDGLGVDFTPSDFEFGSSYVSISDNGKLVYENASRDSVIYSGHIEDDDIEVVSDGYLSESETGCSVKINGKEYAVNNRGINIVVYDLNNDSIVDSLAFDTVDDSGMTRNYNVFKCMWTYTFSDNFATGIEAYINVLIISWKLLIAIIAIIILRLMFVTYDLTFKGKYEKIIKVPRWAIIQLIITILMILAVCLPFGYEYLKEGYEDVSLSQLIYHMNTNLDGTNWSDFNDLFEELIFRAVIVIVINVCIFILIRLIKHNSIKVSVIGTVCVRCIEVVISIQLVVMTIIQFDNNYGLVEYLVTQNTSSSIYEDYYVNPKNAKITFPENKKNLIYIFMESIENTYADSSAGGAENDNYIPELSELALENTCFNGTSNKLNGGEVLDTTGWTIAAMVGQTSGTPLNLPIDGNLYGEDTFLPGAYSLGEILEKNGYNNCIMMGSESDFAGRKTYFEEHGNYEICDYNWAIDNKLIDEDYRVWWGYEDAKLFEFAKDKVIDLAAKNEPFNLSLLTVDTHPTDGYVCDECQEAYDSQYANVIACSSRRIADFIAWIQEQDFYNDTVIVLAGDHLCMDSSYFTNISDNYNRTTYFCIINSDKKQSTNVREYCTLDIFPTTLSALNCEIKGNMLGLGTDLYSNKETLTEIYGHDELNYQINLNSKYYNKYLLGGKEG